MAKLPLQTVSRAYADSNREDLSDIMALLEEPAEEEGEEDLVEAGDLEALLEGLGASAKEREEEEVRSLLERMPELLDESAAKEPPARPLALAVKISKLPRDEARFSLVIEEDEAEPVVTLQELFGPPPVRQSEPEETEEEMGDDTESPLPPVRDPLASRRAMAGGKLQQFVREDIRTRLNFRLLRFLMVTGIERVTLDELQEELVEARDALNGALEALKAVGLLVPEGSGFSLNPRARKLVLLGTAVAQWQAPRTRDELWSWLQP